MSRLQKLEAAAPPGDASAWRRETAALLSEYVRRFPTSESLTKHVVAHFEVLVQKGDADEIASFGEEVSDADPGMRAAAPRRAATARGAPRRRGALTRSSAAHLQVGLRRVQGCPWTAGDFPP